MKVANIWKRAPRRFDWCTAGMWRCLSLPLSLSIEGNRRDPSVPISQLELPDTFILEWLWTKFFSSRSFSSNWLFWVVWSIGNSSRNNDSYSFTFKRRLITERETFSSLIVSWFSSSLSCNCPFLSIDEYEMCLFLRCSRLSSCVCERERESAFSLSSSLPMNNKISLPWEKFFRPGIFTVRHVHCTSIPVGKKNVLFLILVILSRISTDGITWRCLSASPRISLSDSALSPATISTSSWTRTMVSSSEAKP